MRVAPEISWEEGACRSTNPEQVGQTSQSSHKGFIETSGECFSFGKTEHGGHIQGSRKMRVAPDIFGKRERAAQQAMNFIVIKFEQAKRTYTGFPKNEGYTRNFLGRGDAAQQAMNFIVIKFEQAKRASTMWHSMALLNSIYYNSRKKSTV